MLYYFYFIKYREPIKESDLIKKIAIRTTTSYFRDLPLKYTLTVYDIEECFEPNNSLKSRCNLFGGEIKKEITFIGMENIYTLGCYSKDKANDEGKKCEYDWQCEGNCVWLRGDLVIKPDDYKTCSSFKKAFFVSNKKYHDNDRCSYYEKGWRNQMTGDYITRQIKDPSYETIINEQYKNEVSEIMNNYWENSDQMKMSNAHAKSVELLKITVPPSFRNLHKSLIKNLVNLKLLNNKNKHNYTGIKYEEKDITEGIKKNINDLEELKNKYPWMSK